jgi:hypothetical protein
MKELVGLFAVLLIATPIAVLLASGFYGLYLAFSASIILGFLCMFVEGSPLIIGLIMLFFQKNLAQMIVDFFNK